MIAKIILEIVGVLRVISQDTCFVIIIIGAFELLWYFE